MADSPPRPDPDRDTADALRQAPGAGTRPGTPRWVKLFGVIALLLLVLAVVMLVAGGGNHGPGRHSGAGGNGQATAPAMGAAGGEGRHAPPGGGHTP